VTVGLVLAQPQSTPKRAKNPNEAKMFKQDKNRSFVLIFVIDFSPYIIEFITIKGKTYAKRRNAWIKSAEFGYIARDLAVVCQD